MNPTLTIITASISGGLFSFILALINRKDGKDEKMDKILQEIGSIKKDQEKMERDSVRTQLMLMMADFPDDTGEIMRIAQHYFADLHGNWYMTSMFHSWLEKNELEEPIWLKKEA